MSIKSKNAPLESFKTLKDSLQNFHHEEVATDTNGNHHHHTPHKVFVADVIDLAKGKSLSETAVQVGWRYIIKDVNGHAQVVEIGMDEELGTHELSHINMGSHINNFIATCEQLEEHPYVKEKHYEVNVLRIPSIYLMAIWLKGHNHDHEFFIPLAPVHQKFEPNKTYSADDFEILLKKTAQETTGVQEEVVKKEEPAAPQQRPALMNILGITSNVAAVLESVGIQSVRNLLETDRDALMELFASRWGDFNPEVIHMWYEQANLILEEQYDKLRHLQRELASNGFVDYLRSIGVH